MCCLPQEHVSKLFLLTFQFCLHILAFSLCFLGLLVLWSVHILFSGLFNSISSWAEGYYRHSPDMEVSCHLMYKRFPVSNLTIIVEPSSYLPSSLMNKQGDFDTMEYLLSLFSIRLNWKWNAYQYKFFFFLLANINTI